MLMPILAKVVEDLDGAVRLAKVNSDENQDLAAQYGVRSLPTVMLFKNGKPVDQFMGAVPESQVRAFIDDERVAELRARLELARLAALVDDPEARLATDPEDPDARLARGARRALAGDYGPALEDFLAVLARHRSHRDGAARRALLAVFDRLGPDHPLVNEYRPKMARLLY